MVLTILAVLFVLYVTFAIGMRVARDVPDEVEPARKYLAMVPDVLLLLMLGLLLLGIGLRASAIVALVAMIIARAFVTFEHLHIPVSGAILGFATLLTNEQLATICILCLTMNYLVGALAGKRVPVYGAGQPIVACLALILVPLVL